MTDRVWREVAAAARAERDLVAALSARLDALEARVGVLTTRLERCESDVRIVGATLDRAELAVRRR